MDYTLTLQKLAKTWSLLYLFALISKVFKGNAYWENYVGLIISSEGASRLIFLGFHPFQVTDLEEPCMKNARMK